MRAIMISIKPKWVAKILNGEKTIEIRKSYPKCDLPIDVYIYCTKDKQNMLHKNCANIYWVEDTNFKAKNKKLGLESQPYLNGKVVAKFTLNKVEDIEYLADDYCTETYRQKELTRRCCLTDVELNNYLKHETGYAWRVSNLEIFDKPKELSEFKTLKRAKATDCFVCDVYQLTEMCVGKRCLLPKPLTKAPQIFCYIEVE